MGGQTAAPAAAIRAHEELFAYWASLKDGVRLPARRDIRPEAMKSRLPTISLIDILPGDYRFRLAGTGLYGVYGREITGRRIAEIYPSQAADYWRAELGKVIAERKPGVGVHSLAWRGTGHLSIVWLRLPLASDGERVDMLLGYDAVIGMPALATGIRAA